MLAREAGETPRTEQDGTIGWAKDASIPTRQPRKCTWRVRGPEASTPRQDLGCRHPRWSNVGFMIGRSRSSGSCTGRRFYFRGFKRRGTVEVLEAFGMVAQALEGQLWSPAVVLTANKPNHWRAHGQRDGCTGQSPLAGTSYDSEPRRTTCADSCANLRFIGSTALQLVRQ